MTKKQERFTLKGEDVVKKIKEIIAEGHARKISIENEKGEQIASFTLTVGIIGTVLAPMLAAIGALAALLTKCTIIVEKRN